MKQKDFNLILNINFGYRRVQELEKGKVLESYHKFLALEVNILFKTLCLITKFHTLVPARITSFGGQIVRPWRSMVMLSCTAVGTPRREWYRGDYVLKEIADHSQQLLDTGELIINNVQLSDSGNYTCQVDNGQGSDKLTYNLLVQVPPDAPLLYVSSATSSSVLLHWKAGSNGRAPIRGYTLNYKKERGDLNEVFLSRHITSYELKVSTFTFNFITVTQNILRAYYVVHPIIYT